jgi:hypothetical protein
MKELASEDTESYKGYLRMSLEKCEELLVVVGQEIEKESTWLRKQSHLQ